MRPYQNYNISIYIHTYSEIRGTPLMWVNLCDVFLEPIREGVVKINNPYRCDINLYVINYRNHPI